MESLPSVAPSWQQSTSGSNESERSEQLAELTKILLGCFRKGEANDPEIYSGAVLAVLSDYPIEIVQAVVDPRTGLPSRIDWYPTVAEVKRACEELAAPLRDRLAREKREQQQLAERKTLALTHQKRRKTYEEIQAELAEKGMFIGGKSASAAPVNVAEVQEKYGITKDQWDAIPNAPRRKDRE